MDLQFALDFSFSDMKTKLKNHNIITAKNKINPNFNKILSKRTNRGKYD